MYNTEGYSSAAPYLLVRNACSALTFLEQVFHAERLRVIERDGGDGIMHAEARIDDTVIMMGETPDGTDANVHVYVDDPEATFQRALDAGASEVQLLTESGDGDRRGGVRDADGKTWWIAKQVSASP